MVLVHSDVKNRPLVTGDSSVEVVYRRRTSTTSHKIDQNFGVSNSQTEFLACPETHDTHSGCATDDRGANAAPTNIGSYIVPICRVAPDLLFQIPLGPDLSRYAFSIRPGTGAGARFH